MRIARLHGRTNDGDDDNDYARSDNDGANSRGSGDETSAASPRRNADGGAGARIRLDDRLLAMDGNRLCLGAGQLDRSAEASRSLGGGPLGPSARRLGLDCRPLAVRSRPINYQILVISHQYR